MKLCLSILPESAEMAEDMLRSAPSEADLVELRIDKIPHAGLTGILRQKHHPVIVTNRRLEEGGHFRGTTNEQVGILTEALRAGAEYVDIEYSWGKTAVRKLLSTRVRGSVICSHHDPERTPNDLSGLASRMVATGAPVIKIATMARDIRDNAVIFNIMNEIRRRRRRVIGLCMGEYGQISRILGGRYGGFLTYVSPDNGEVTAPGQYTLSEAFGIFRVPSITRRTAVFGLLGNPVKFSRGYRYHNDGFRKRRLDAVYVNFLADDPEGFLNTFGRELRGLSITMPFKNAMLRFVRPADNVIEQIGAVNTIIRNHGRSAGYNTDYSAILRCTEKRYPLRGRSVLVLGTGSMSRTMIVASRISGADVVVAGRSAEKASALASLTGCRRTEWDGIGTLRPDVIMNGTSAGMGSDIPVRIIAATMFRKGMCAVESIYNPVDTAFCLDARSRGAVVITGLDLFETQAAMQARLFAGALR